MTSNVLISTNSNLLSDLFTSFSPQPQNNSSPILPYCPLIQASLTNPLNSPKNIFPQQQNNTIPNQLCRMLDCSLSTTTVCISKRDRFCASLINCLPIFMMIIWDIRASHPCTLQLMWLLFGDMSKVIKLVSKGAIRR